MCPHVGGVVLPPISVKCRAWRASFCAVGCFSLLCHKIFGYIRSVHASSRLILSRLRHAITSESAGGRRDV